MKRTHVPGGFEGFGHAREIADAMDVDDWETKRAPRRISVGLRRVGRSSFDRTPSRRGDPTLSSASESDLDNHIDAVAELKKKLGQRGEYTVPEGSIRAVAKLLMDDYYGNMEQAVDDLLESMRQPPHEVDTNEVANDGAQTVQQRPPTEPPKSGPRLRVGAGVTSAKKRAAS